MTIKVVFFATPDIALKTLKYLYSSPEFDVVAVVTQPDKPSGRGQKMIFSPIKEFALKNDITIYQPVSIRKEPDILCSLKTLKPDFFVTFAFGQILSQEVLDIPKYATINLHASLLPKYRGANPIQRAIINGDKQTGVCTMITELGLDCGDICLKKVIDISEDMNCEELYNTISDISPSIVGKTLIDLYNKKLTPIPQCKNGICMASKLSKDECLINWSDSADKIHNLVRGIYKSPSAYFVHNEKIIKVLQTKVVDEIGECGKFIRNTRNGIVVGCGKKSILLVKVKPEGKGEMLARDWYNGLRI